MRLQTPNFGPECLRKCPTSDALPCFSVTKVKFVAPRGPWGTNSSQNPVNASEVGHRRRTKPACARNFSAEVAAGAGRQRWRRARDGRYADGGGAQGRSAAGLRGGPRREAAGAEQVRDLAATPDYESAGLLAAALGVAHGLWDAAAWRRR